MVLVALQLSVVIRHLLVQKWCKTSIQSCMHLLPWCSSFFNQNPQWQTGSCGLHSLNHHVMRYIKVNLRRCHKYARRTCDYFALSTKNWKSGFLGPIHISHSFLFLGFYSFGTLRVELLTSEPALLAQLVAWLLHWLGGTGLESLLGWPFIFISPHPRACKLWPEWFPNNKQ